MPPGLPPAETRTTASAPSVRPYVLAISVTGACVALTRALWPVFGSTPFALVFGAVALATHFGSGPAGLVAIAVATIGAALTFPSAGPPPWNPTTAYVFIVVALIGNRAIAGRNRAAAALRESEAQLRATLEHLRESEATVREAHKMEAIGQLAAGVAHNFNNLLTITMGYCDVLGDADGDDDLRQMAIAEIRKATARGATLARQMLAFGRKHRPRVARVPLDRTVLDLRDMLTQVIREDIVFRIDAGAGAAAVMIDPHDLEQVVFNLVINARDALPEGGEIHVATARETIGAGDRRLGTSIAPGEFVRLSVRDDGVGMSSDVQARLFEPFFTTKEVGDGTGLGLAFIHGVARHGGGFVTVDSASGKGTTVCVYLPPAAAVAEADPPATSLAPEPEANARRARSGPTILLVEDEDSVRVTTARLLARAGYEVVQATGPAEARVLFDRDPEIALLITDVVMPEMRGPVLAALLRAKRPDLGVLFVSGYTDDIIAGEAPGGRVAFLAKPFSLHALADSVAALLEREAEPEPTAADATPG
jgi:two-component system cell cycle sensor histidine kinase/response regulator CckA